MLLSEFSRLRPTMAIKYAEEGVPAWRPIGRVPQLYINYVFHVISSALNGVVIRLQLDFIHFDKRHVCKTNVLSYIITSTFDITLTTQKPVNIERDWLRHHAESWYSELLVYTM